MPLNTELVATLLQPIAGDNPSGKDLRYDPRYDAVKEARREDLDLPQGGLATDRKVADWNAVINQVTNLAKETKDLQLFAWLAEALLNKQGFGGFATGFETVRGLLAQFWDTFYPLPEDDDVELRVGPLEWLGSAKLGVTIRLSSIAQNGLPLATFLSSRAVPTEAEGNENRDKRNERAEALGQGKMPPEEADAALEATNKAFYKALNADLDLAIASLATLEKMSDEKLGRDAPTFNPLRIAMEELRRFSGSVLAKKLESDPDPIEETPEPGEGGVVSDDGPISAEPTNRNDANARVAIVAKWFRQQDPTSPAPYLMLRGFRWGELRATAPELNPKMLEAPPTPIRARLKGLMIDGKWSDLLEHGEGLMATAQGRGWLDLQRYTLTACSNLGSAYDAVATAIRSELRALLVSLPQLPEMTLMDDTPTANGETKEWLKAEGLTGDPPPAETVAEDASAGEDVPGDDGSAALDDALVQDDATSQQGGLARPRARRRTPTSVGAAGVRDAFESARSELTQGRPNRAIELLVAELARERSPRGRFVRQTQLAWIMVEGSMDNLAKPILERLIETISERSLEDWEAGPLVAQPLALLHRVLERQGVDESTRDDLYLRVCRLDPMQAIALRPAH